MAKKISIEDLRDSIFVRTQRNEGLRLKPYRCTERKLTIGYGRNIEDNGITKQEAIFLMKNDIIETGNALYRIFGDQVLPWGVMEAFVDMLINMGETKFKGFVNMIKAAKNKDWESTVKEAIDSKWYRKHKELGSKRADEAVNLIRTAIE